MIRFVALLVMLAVIFPISNAPMLAAILAVVVAALSVTRFAALATEFARPPAARGHDRTTRPPRVPADELARRSNLPLPD